MKELAVRVWVEDEDTCHWQCPFLEDNECLLFNKQLKDTQLPEFKSWQDGQNPTKQRYHGCQNATG